ncbi:MAG: transglutaminase family protein [Anaerolineales bacterium]|nr:transglutaminase family protein [Anaerolineales bacterium]
MRLRIEHITTLIYDQPVSEAYTEMRLQPLNADGQQRLSFQLNIEPLEETHQYTDRFGNDVRHFDVIQPHQKLMVAAVSEVQTPKRFTGWGEPLAPLDHFDYLQPTEYAPLTAELSGLAVSHMESSDVRANVLALMHALFNGLKYEKGVTDVTTTADKALALGGGVCQDFAHIMLAACRSQGLPARYVSGYLYNNGHTAASHAWLDVYVVGRGWVSVDPTHNCEQTDYYVRVAVGRDYADVPPTRGIFKGNAKEKMEVGVKVAQIG